MSECKAQSYPYSSACFENCAAQNVFITT